MRFMPENAEHAGIRKDDTGSKLSEFKQCPKCKTIWRERSEFLNDPDIKLIGYQANFRNLELGLLMFNHMTCRTTLSLEAGKFSDMYKGPVFKSRLTGSDQCPGYCLHKSVLRPCPEECECAYVRSIIDMIKKSEIVDKVEKTD